jgi:hypothetical protein
MSKVSLQFTANGLIRITIFKAKCNSGKARPSLTLFISLRGCGEPVPASAGRGSRVIPPFSLSQPREYTRVLEFSSKNAKMLGKCAKISPLCICILPEQHVLSAKFVSPPARPRIEDGCWVHVMCTCGSHLRLKLSLPRIAGRIEFWQRDANLLEFWLAMMCQK